jgi:hypothetical protein
MYLAWFLFEAGLVLPHLRLVGGTPFEVAWCYPIWGWLVLPHFRLVDVTPFEVGWCYPIWGWLVLPHLRLVGITPFEVGWCYPISCLKFISMVSGISERHFTFSVWKLCLLYDLDLFFQMLLCVIVPYCFVVTMCVIYVSLSPPVGHPRKRLTYLLRCLCPLSIFPSSPPDRLTQYAANFDFSFFLVFFVRMMNSRNEFALFVYVFIFPLRALLCSVTRFTCGFL